MEDAATWYERIHPDDKDRLNAEYAAMIPSSQPFESSYRISPGMEASSGSGAKSG